jgi:hypothetical protein
MSSPITGTKTDRRSRAGLHGWSTTPEECDVVLVICTPRLKARYSKREDPSVGRGAVFEGAIINQARRNFEVAADPVLDFLVENTSGGPLLFLRVGIRILQRKPGTGGVLGCAQPIKVQAEYSVHCHEDWKRFNLQSDQSWASFPDPVWMRRDDRPFRATLRLENFCDADSASLSEIRFSLETSSGTIESESIWLEQ